MGMIGYFAEIDSEKINQLLESTEKPLMDNIHDTLVMLIILILLVHCYLLRIFLLTIISMVQYVAM